MAKRGVKRRIPKQFKGLVNRVQSTTSKNITATIVYILNVGFKVHGKENAKSNKLVAQGDAFVVGVYSAGVPSEYLVEDLIFAIDQAAGVI